MQTCSITENYTQTHDIKLYGIKEKKKFVMLDVHLARSDQRENKYTAKIKYNSKQKKMFKCITY